MECTLTLPIRLRTEQYPPKMTCSRKSLKIVFNEAFPIQYSTSPILGLHVVTAVLAARVNPQVIPPAQCSAQDISDAYLCLT